MLKIWARIIQGMLLFKGKYITPILFLILVSFYGYGQQDPMFSQYMYNKLSINPGYAGSKGGLFGIALYRKQWVNIQGAPTSQTFAVHSPFMGQKMGLGLNIVNDKIGVSQRLNIFGSYSYKIFIEEKTISFGIQGGLTRFGNDWSQIRTSTPKDPSFVSGNESFLLPNIGAGVYYNDQKYFAGLSIPYLITHTFNKKAPQSQAKLVRHFFLNGGGLFELNHMLKLRPTVLLKYVSGAPLQADLNLSVVIKERFWPGLSFRTGDGISAMFQLNLKDHLWMGYAYDYPFTDLRKHTSGGHEIFISYTYFIKRPKVYSPRYF